MATPNYRLSRDEIVLESLYREMDELDEEISALKKQQYKILDQIFFLEDDVTRKGRM